VLLAGIDGFRTNLANAGGINAGEKRKKERRRYYFIAGLQSYGQSISLSQGRKDTYLRVDVASDSARIRKLTLGFFILFHMSQA